MVTQKEREQIIEDFISDFARWLDDKGIKLIMAPKNVVGIAIPYEQYMQEKYEQQRILMNAYD